MFFKILKVSLSFDFFKLFFSWTAFTCRYFSYFCFSYLYSSHYCFSCYCFYWTDARQFKSKFNSRNNTCPKSSPCYQHFFNKSIKNYKHSIAWWCIEYLAISKTLMIFLPLCLLFQFFRISPTKILVYCECQSWAQFFLNFDFFKKSIFFAL
jgi:hypothetical protein